VGTESVPFCLKRGGVPPNHPAVGVPPAVGVLPAIGNLPGGGRWMLDGDFIGFSVYGFYRELGITFFF